MPKLKKKTKLPSAIEEQAVADGTVLTAEMIKKMNPASQVPELDFLVKMGGPVSDNPFFFSPKKSQPANQADQQTALVVYPHVSVPPSLLPRFIIK